MFNILLLKELKDAKTGFYIMNITTVSILKAKEKTFLTSNVIAWR